MVRLIAFLAGLFFVVALLYSFVMGFAQWASEDPVESAEHAFHLHPKKVKFASDGPLGKWDQAELQRGLKVYKEVCAACHSLRLVSFRNFADLGYTEGQIKTIAAEWPIEAPTINPETGEPATRKAIPTDTIPLPYLNETAARAANGNALPPDLSLITKARHNGGAYVYSLMTGYKDAKTYKNAKGEKIPAANQPGQGLYFNPYFANLNLAMPAPITSDGQVTYDDGTKATVSQMSHDVASFLIWTAEPKMMQRKAAGWAVVIFLLVATGLAYASKRQIWADKH